MNWKAVIWRLVQEHHWTPQQIAAMSFPALCLALEQDIEHPAYDGWVDVDDLDAELKTVTG